MIDLDTLKGWLGVENDDHDALLTDLEVRAVAFLEQQTGRHFSASDETLEFLTGNGKRALWLSEKPVGSVTVEKEVIEDDAVTWEEVESTKYQIRDYQLIHNTYWCAGETYRVTYTRGYAEGSEPEDIKQAVLDLCALKYRGRGNEGVRSETSPDYSYTVSDVIAVPGLHDTIDRWRWVSV